MPPFTNEDILIFHYIMAKKTEKKPLKKFHTRFTDEDPSVYKEPAPLDAKIFGQEKENPLESMMERFDKAAEILQLEKGIYLYLKTPVKCVIVSVPVTMDDGRVEIFEGFRVVHNDILVPSKGGI